MDTTTSEQKSDEQNVSSKKQRRSVIRSLSWKRANKRTKMDEVDNRQDYPEVSHTRRRLNTTAGSYGMSDEDLEEEIFEPDSSASSSKKRKKTGVWKAVKRFFRKKSGKSSKSFATGDSRSPKSQPQRSISDPNLLRRDEDTPQLAPLGQVNETSMETQTSSKKAKSHDNLLSELRSRQRGSEKGESSGRKKEIAVGQSKSPDIDWQVSPSSAPDKLLPGLNASHDKIRVAPRHRRAPTRRGVASARHGSRDKVDGDVMPRSRSVGDGTLNTVIKEKEPQAIELKKEQKVEESQGNEGEELEKLQWLHDGNKLRRKETLEEVELLEKQQSQSMEQNSEQGRDEIQKQLQVGEEFENFENLVQVTQEEKKLQKQPSLELLEQHILKSENPELLEKVNELSPDEELYAREMNEKQNLEREELTEKLKEDTLERETYQEMSEKLEGGQIVCWEDQEDRFYPATTTTKDFSDLAENQPLSLRYSSKSEITYEVESMDTDVGKESSAGKTVAMDDSNDDSYKRNEVEIPKLDAAFHENFDTTEKKIENSEIKTPLSPAALDVGISEKVCVQQTSVAVDDSSDANVAAVLSEGLITSQFMTSSDSQDFKPNDNDTLILLSEKTYSKVEDEKFQEYQDHPSANLATREVPVPSEETSLLLSGSEEPKRSYLNDSPKSLIEPAGISHDIQEMVGNPESIAFANNLSGTSQSLTSVSPTSPVRSKRLVIETPEEVFQKHVMPVLPKGETSKRAESFSSKGLQRKRPQSMHGRIIPKEQERKRSLDESHVAVVKLTHAFEISANASNLTYRSNTISYGERNKAEVRPKPKVLPKPGDFQTSHEHRSLSLGRNYRFPVRTETSEKISEFSKKSQDKDDVEVVLNEKETEGRCEEQESISLSRTKKITLKAVTRPKLLPKPKILNPRPGVSSKMPEESKENIRASSNFRHVSSSSMTTSPAEAMNGRTSTDEESNVSDVPMPSFWARRCIFSPEQKAKDISNSTLSSETPEKIKAREGKHPPLIQLKTDMCAVCGAKVYQMEKFKVKDNIVHRSCIKCSVCKRLLSVGNFIMSQNKIYCKPHEPPLNLTLTTS